jgi:predicted CopG family antitoxin
MEKTTIQINQSTLDRLKSLKRYERESYDEILNNLIIEAEDDTLSEDEIEDLKESLEEVKQGNIKPIEKVAKELGISLQ